MRLRFIIVPKNKEAEKDLDYNKATEEQLIEFLLNEEDFFLLEKEGLIKLINESGASNIDDYEDDCVAGKENIKNVIESLNRRDSSLDNTLSQLILKIKDLFEEALNRGTGVYFYF